MAAVMVAIQLHIAFGCLFTGSLFLCHLSSLVSFLSILQMISGGVLLLCGQRQHDFSLFSTAVSNQAVSATSNSTSNTYHSLAQDNIYF